MPSLLAIGFSARCEQAGYRIDLNQCELRHAGLGSIQEFAGSLSRSNRARKNRSPGGTRIRRIDSRIPDRSGVGVAASHRRRAAATACERVRKRIEEAFGWIKTTGRLRKTRHRGMDRVGRLFTLTAAACDLVRLPKLLEAT